MTNETLMSALSLGLILGLRHAFDPDHIAAVSTIVSEAKSVRRSSIVGTSWGLGHAMSLFIAGVLVIALKVQISDRVALWMEFAVALMLVLLGVKALLRSFRGWKLHVHRHTHGGHSHIHAHLHRLDTDHVHSHRHLIRSGAQPFAVGLVHGLAGSSGLMILVLATIPSAVGGLIYIVVFGLGSIGGMLLMSCLISLPFVFGKRFTALGETMQLIVGLSSTAFGLFLALQIGWQQF